MATKSQTDHEISLWRGVIIRIVKSKYTYSEKAIHVSLSHVHGRSLAEHGHVIPPEVFIDYVGNLKVGDEVEVFVRKVS